MGRSSKHWQKIEKIIRQMRKQIIQESLCKVLASDGQNYLRILRDKQAHYTVFLSRSKVQQKERK
jgi:bisphosphoglycerate-independent phosphoglycerate mutase (AlkP superfamily)